MPLALRLTALELVLRPMGPWTVRPLILAGAIVALLSPRALCRREQRALQAAYLGTWGLVLLYSEVPWANLAIRWFGDSG